ncbi:Helix-turn-helix protein [Candidatus Regiella insecticola 5.15]|uniref:Helix-turn-helix protein n=2 Tax=Candidatus Regiella insecticola TaxID=138073 RepID=G2GZB0_9ENTR|nr:helix-turn-helix domain-containing protein [Candidatus Regiella insecticola]EGY28922.1 Helix-turn-helix protein [Candidatus Regiella insecticola 5.15]GFN45238.1 helix-turn-helix protein [Candidatus Regiella insecticola]
MNTNITSAERLAHVLRDERKKRKLSQSETAKSILMKQSTVSNFENYPDRTRLDTLFRLLAALDLELQITNRNENSSDRQAWDQEW